MDWILTNVGGVVMIITFSYVTVKMTIYSLGKLLCYIGEKKVNHGS